MLQLALQILNFIFSIYTDQRHTTASWNRFALHLRQYLRLFQWQCWQNSTSCNSLLFCLLSGEFSSNRSVVCELSPHGRLVLSPRLISCRHRPVDGCNLSTIILLLLLILPSRNVPVWALLPRWVEGTRWVGLFTNSIWKITNSNCTSNTFTAGGQSVVYSSNDVSLFSTTPRLSK